MPAPGYLASAQDLQLAGVDVQKLREGVHERISRKKVSNRLALTCQHLAPTGNDLRKWLLQLLGGEEATFPLATALRVSLNRVKVEYKKLIKGKDVVDHFLAAVYQLPSRAVVYTEVSEVLRKRREAEDSAQCVQHLLDQAQHEVIGLKRVVEDLQVQMRNLTTEYDLLLASKRKLETDAVLAKETLRRSQFKLMRTNRDLEKETQRKEEKKREVRQLRDRLGRRSATVDCKCGKFIERSKEMQRRITNLLLDVRQRDEIIDTLAEQCQEMDAQVMPAKVGKAYSPAVRCLCMKLISSKVPLENIPIVIADVFSAAGKELSDVPGERTVRRIANTEMLSLAQSHVAVKLSQSSNLTLQTDETSKFGQQFLASAVRTETGETLVLGLNEMPNKSAQSTLTILKEKLGDLERVSGEVGVANKIALQLKCTMSDRASTEKLFNSMLQKYKKEICPLVIANWAELNEEQQMALVQVESFFCSLHLLANFAEVMSKVLLRHEEGMADPENLGSLRDHTGFKSNEPGVFRLVRTASKCFARRGSAHGMYYKWCLFLETNGINLPKFAPFKGNRFNVVFFNAEVVFVAREFLINFLELHGENRLHRAVLADLKEPLFLGELKVLALIGKVISGPLWRLLELERHVLDMNAYFTSLIHWLNGAAQDPTDFLVGESMPFSRELLHNDEVFRSIISFSDCNAAAAPIASLALTAISGLLKEMCKDHLPGGKYFEPNESLRKATTSVPLHNKAPEAIFGFLDSLMTRRPNAGILVNEALIMFSKNRTREWLDAKTPEEAMALVKAAQSNSQQLRHAYQERSAALKAAAIQRLHDKQQCRINQLTRTIRQKERITTEMLSDGLWQSLAEIDQKLLTFSGERQKLLALKRQLHFRERVLEQPAPEQPSDQPKFYQFMVNKVPRTVVQLRDKLIQLVSDASQGTQFVDDLDLVGKRIEHRLVDAQTIQDNWLRGTVIATVPGYSAWYNVVYESEPSTVYTFKLGDDFASKRLRVV